MYEEIYCVQVKIETKCGDVCLGTGSSTNHGEILTQNQMVNKKKRIKKRKAPFVKKI